MARRQPGRNGGGRSGRGSVSRGQSSGSGHGGVLGALAVVAAALAGGSYLYLHTPATPQADTASGTATQRAEPAPQRPRASAPSAALQQPGGPATFGSSVKHGDSRSQPDSAHPQAGVPSAPFGTSEEVFEAGARVYAANCASCHGRPGRNGSGPSAAQFWDRSNAAGLHAVAEPVGGLYQATAQGNLAQGMPSYGQRLTDTQIWDVALLLRSAHEDLPDPVLRLLRGGR